MEKNQLQNLIFLKFSKNLKLTKKKVMEDVTKDEIENQYQQNTNNARDNKVFGSPTFFVGMNSPLMFFTPADLAF